MPKYERKQLEAIFAALDKNNDGYLEYWELLRVLQEKLKMSEKMAKEACQVSFLFTDSLVNRCQMYVCQILKL